MLRAEPQGSTREAQGLRKQSVQTRDFFPVRGALFRMAKQMYNAVLLVLTELLRYNDLMKSERGDDLFFGDHPNFGNIMRAQALFK